MLSSNIPNVLIFLLSAFVYGAHSVDYSDLQALGVACRDQRDRCTGYRNNGTYLDRNCECDFACNAYKDCCVDALSRQPNRRATLSKRMACMPYGPPGHTGVFMVVNCSSTWQGTSEIREKCEGPMDFSDPLKAAPVVSVAQAVTYRNRYCAECNHAHMPTLKSFHVKVGCSGLPPLSKEQIFAGIKYNRRYDTWGVDRPNSFGNETVFNDCDVVYDVPTYVNRSVRFCRANVISSCPSNWTRPIVRKSCEDYMAVVYDNDLLAYRNAHCALCNYKRVREVFCESDLHGRKKPPAMSFALLLDINRDDGDCVGMSRTTCPGCPANHIYDPFDKICRNLVCALPNHVVVNGKCVRQ